LSESAARSWIACQFYYHEDLDFLLRNLLVPLVRDRLIRGDIARFYFVRYALGGPHVRLRLLAGDQAGAGALLQGIEREAMSFFSRFPSRRSLAEEEIRRRNRAILAGDPSEHDDAIYPDNSFRAVAFHPELERYGGAENFQHSLDAFVLSSVTALETLEELSSQERSRRRAAFFRLLARQALGLADSGEELLALLSRLALPPSESWAPVAERADQAFAGKPKVFCRLLAGPGDDARALLLSEGARRLRREIQTGDLQTWSRIAVSQLHMTANRLGLGNPEELYLGRLLYLSAQETRRSWPARWAELFAERRSPEEGRLGDLVAAALDRFAGAASSGLVA
jgi:hypothetical protein